MTGVVCEKRAAAHRVPSTVAPAASLAFEDLVTFLSIG
jgi:hypothetical protein